MDMHARNYHHCRSQIHTTRLPPPSLPFVPLHLSGLDECAAVRLVYMYDDVHRTTLDKLLR